MSRGFIVSLSQDGGEDDDDENVKFSSNLPEIVSSEKVGILFEVLPLGG